MNSFGSGDYMSAIKSKVSGNVPVGKTKLIKSEDDICPTVKNYREWLDYNHTVPQLKKVLSQFHLLVGGTKRELQTRIYIYFSLMDASTRIQKIFRGFLLRRFFQNFKIFNSLKDSCVNETDFYTFEPLANIPYFQFIAFTSEEDHKTYGFNLSSLHQYFNHNSSQKQTENPYTRSIFPLKFISQVRYICNNAMKYGVEIKLTEEDDEAEGLISLTSHQNNRSRAVKLFHEIDLLGNYTNINWFMTLNGYQLIKMVDVLYDIWNYRAQIPQATKINIYPPHGNPFQFFRISSAGQVEFTKLQNEILGLLEKFVYYGVDRDSKSLGAFYVLGAITLVNYDAANSLPWLYQSFAI